MSQDPLKKYKQAQVLTASREKLLIMMYEGAIKFLKQAIEAGTSHDNSERTRLIGRTQDIVSELRSTLNYEASKDIASELDKLYVFISGSLLKALQSLDQKPLEDSLKILVTLNEAWVGAVNNLAQPLGSIQEDK